ncbi:CO dehydrogenase/acetyl-CoA synthase complex subunit epsilon [Candidatus Bathyarchaeota archaeon]|nr:CO dehydrogenase/acetyl-CoA synthase complex subunit epsilon [Candidatus Bathyarchaeota archaeon]
MGARAEPWQKAEIAGPKKALLILKPEVIVALVKKSKRSLLVISHEASEEYTEDVKMIDFAIRLSQTAGIPIVATGHTSKELVKKGVQPKALMSAMDIGNRLADPEWKGLDGKGPYELALFIGLPYYMQFVILSGLKHFSTNLKTISLDRFYNPHASWSFPNLSVKEWKENVDTVISKLEGA